MTHQCAQCGDEDEWVRWSDWYGLHLHSDCEDLWFECDMADDELARRKEGEGL